MCVCLYVIQNILYVVIFWFLLNLFLRLFFIFSLMCANNCRLSCAVIVSLSLLFKWKSWQFSRKNNTHTSPFLYIYIYLVRLYVIYNLFYDFSQNSWFLLYIYSKKTCPPCLQTVSSIRKEEKIINSIKYLMYLHIFHLNFS